MDPRRHRKTKAIGRANVLTLVISGAAGRNRTHYPLVRRFTHPSNFRLDVFWWVEVKHGPAAKARVCLMVGGMDGARTRDPRRDRPVSAAVEFDRLDSVQHTFRTCQARNCSQIVPRGFPKD